MVIIMARVSFAVHVSSRLLCALEKLCLLHNIYYYSSHVLIVDGCPLIPDMSMLCSSVCCQSDRLWVIHLRRAK